MRHRLSGLSTYGLKCLKGQCAGDEHSAYASGHGPFYLYPTFSTSKSLSQPHKGSQNDWLPVRGRVDYRPIRSPSSAIKPPNYINLRTFLLYFRPYRVFWGHLCSTYCQHNLHRQTLLSGSRRFLCCVPTIWNSLPSFVRTAE